MSHQEFAVLCSCKGKIHSTEGATEESLVLTGSKNQVLEHKLLGQSNLRKARSQAWWPLEGGGHEVWMRLVVWSS